MIYRFGDATPFPLNENFIDTICAATETCVVLFEATAVKDAQREKARSISERAENELKRLEVLGRAVEAAVGPMIGSGKPSTTSEITATRLAQSCKSTIKNARSNLIRRRDGAIRRSLADATGEKVTSAVGEFLLRHQLPETEWSVRWIYDPEKGRATVVVSSTAPCELRGEFEASLPDNHRWAQPVRVEELEPAMVVEIQRETGWFKKHPGLSSQPLHRLYITEVEITPERKSFVLRKSHKKPSPGYLVVMREGSETIPRLTRLDADGKTGSLPLTLSGDSGKSLTGLWQQIESGIVGLRRYRAGLLAASYAETAIEELEQPSQLAGAILDALAPVIREMRVRSKVPGELVLKRDTGDGRREELFVPRRRLESKFESLPDQYRRHFEAIGLSSETTTEFIGRHLPAAVPVALPKSRSRPNRARRSPVPPPPPLPRKMKSPLLRDLPMPPPIPRKKSPLLREVGAPIEFPVDEDETLTRGAA